MTLHRFHLDPSGAEGGSPTPAPTPVPTPAPAPAPAPAANADASERFARLLAKNDGDATRLAGKLHSENFKLREKVRTLEESRPPEGSRLLTKEEADEFEGLRSIGRADEVRRKIADADRFREEAEGLRRADTRKEAARINGYKVAVLSDLLNRDKLDVEVRQEKVNGKPSEVAYVKGVDGQGKPTEARLAEHAKEHWADYLDSLNHTPDRAQAGTPRRGDPSGPPPPRKTEPTATLSYAAGF